MWKADIYQLSIQRSDVDLKYFGEDKDIRQNHSLWEMELATQLVSIKESVGEKTKQGNKTFSHSILTQAKKGEGKVAMMPSTEIASNLLDDERFMNYLLKEIRWK